MSTSNAWLLDCGESLSIAVGDHELVELLQTDRWHPVPGSPSYCSRVLQWQEKTVPIMDIGALHGAAGPQETDSYLCLLNYQEAPNSPLQQMAIPVTGAPQRIQVDDAQLCEFPREFDNSRLKPVTLSCFTHHAKPVLVLDIAGLCSTGFRDLACAG